MSSLPYSASITIKIFKKKCSVFMVLKEMFGPQFYGTEEKDISASDTDTALYGFSLNLLTLNIHINPDISFNLACLMFS